MPSPLIEAVGGMSALLGVGTFTLLGMRMWFRYRPEQRRGLGTEDAQRLAGAVDAIHDDLRTVREELAECQERLDFTERLLSRGTPNKRVTTLV